MICVIHSSCCTSCSYEERGQIIILYGAVRTNTKTILLNSFVIFHSREVQDFSNCLLLCISKLIWKTNTFFDVVCDSASTLVDAVEVQVLKLLRLPLLFLMISSLHCEV